MMEIVKGLIGNALTSTAADHVVAVAKDIYDEKQERYQDDINSHLLEQVQNINDSTSCFNSGLWENLLHWSNIPLWNNNKFAITDNLQQQIAEQQKTHVTDIKKLAKHLEDSDTAFTKAVADNDKKHEVIDKSLSEHKQQIKALENLIQEHDQQITDLLNGLCCFDDGQWSNDLKWSNVALWEDSNLMYDTFADIYNQISEHKKIIQALNNRIENIKKEAEESLRLINKTFDGFRKEHQAFREEHNAFKQEHESFRKEHQTIGKRIDDVNERQDHAEKNDSEQQRQIDMLLYRISLVTNGLWDNVLLWVNDSEWSNVKGVGEGEACNCPGDTQDKIEALQKRLTETNKNVSNDHTLIVENQQDINALKKESTTEHRGIKYQLRAIGREQDSQDEKLAGLGEHFGCFVDGEWGNLCAWDNDHVWANQPGIVAELQIKVAEHDDRLTALETMLIQLTAQLSMQKAVIEQQQEQLGAMMDCFTVTNIGVWQNPLLWNNNTKWSDSLITEQIENGGTTSVSVKSYDERTETVSI